MNSVFVLYIQAKIHNQSPTVRWDFELLSATSEVFERNRRWSSLRCRSDNLGGKRQTIGARSPVIQRAYWSVTGHVWSTQILPKNNNLIEDAKIIKYRNFQSSASVESQLREITQVLLKRQTWLYETVIYNRQWEKLNDVILTTNVCVRASVNEISLYFSKKNFLRWLLVLPLCLCCII